MSKRFSLWGKILVVSVLLTGLMGLQASAQSLNSTSATNQVTTQNPQGNVSQQPLQPGSTGLQPTATSQVLSDTTPTSVLENPNIRLVQPSGSDQNQISPNPAVQKALNKSFNWIAMLAVIAGTMAFLTVAYIIMKRQAEALKNN